MLLDFMTRHWRRHAHGTLLIPASLLLVTLVACGRDAKTPVAPPPVQGLAPDFSLTDVNPNSASSAQAVSPRQQLTKISAWYFGAAT